MTRLVIINDQTINWSRNKIHDCILKGCHVQILHTRVAVEAISLASYKSDVDCYGHCFGLAMEEMSIRIVSSYFLYFHRC